MRDRDFGLDALRALAILGVLLLHVAASVPGIPAALMAVCARGWAGVDLFFVLSGYLIASQSFDSRQGTASGGALRWAGRFWIRRWTRTVPLYAVVLFVYAVLKPAVFGYPFNGFSWKFFFFLQNTGEIRDFVQSWSLCIEEQFYLCFPLAFLALRRATRWAPIEERGGWVWLVPLLASMAFRAAYWYRIGMPLGLSNDRGPSAFDPPVRFATQMHLDGISVGIFLAATRDVWAGWSARVRGAIGAAGAALLAATLSVVTYSPNNPAMIWLFAANAVGFGALLVAFRGVPRPRLIGAPVRRLALWSYGAYLWNSLLIRVFDHYWRSGAPKSWALGSALFLGATLAISAITYVLVEQPGMKLRERVEPLLAPAAARTAPGV